MIIFLLPWLLLSCKPGTDRQVSPAFYYWKSVFKLSDDVRESLDRGGVKKLYIRFFDVVWEDTKGPVPVAPVEFRTPVPQAFEVVPTVYITNQTLVKIAPGEVERLADRIYEKISQQLLRAGVKDVREIQLDCDWTLATRDKYFGLLKAFRKSAEGRKLSATIRLHQVKFAGKTGVPPVDRGLLMFYNMGSLKDTSTANSIYDTGTAQKYLSGFDEYPLPLDVGLPAYSWGVLIRRGKVVNLIYDADRGLLGRDRRFREIRPGKFRAEQAVSLNHIPLLPGDIVRMEEVGPDLCLEAAALISPYLKSDTLTVSLFHLDKKITDHYDQTVLEKIFSVFR